MCWSVNLVKKQNLMHVRNYVFLSDERDYIKT